MTETAASSAMEAAHKRRSHGGMRSSSRGRIYMRATAAVHGFIERTAGATLVLLVFPVVLTSGGDRDRSG